MTAHFFGMHVAQQCHVDPRLAFLARASARLVLVEHGEMDIGEAFDGLIESLTCSCALEMAERWERDSLPQKSRRHK
jgi:hypothetical protein